MGEHEGLNWHCSTRLRKYHGDWTYVEIADGVAGDPYEQIESEGNLLMTAGIKVMLQLATARATPAAFSNVNARIGVGDSTATAVATQTDLQALVNVVRVGMDSGFPKVGVADGLAADNLVLFSATFPPGVAEWITGWQEWAIFNASSAGTMLNRKVENKGVKGVNTTWQFQVQVQIT